MRTAWVIKFIQTSICDPPRPRIQSSKLCRPRSSRKGRHGGYRLLIYTSRVPASILVMDNSEGRALDSPGLTPVNPILVANGG
jgi:hypothetical protein